MNVLWKPGRNLEEDKENQVYNDALGPRQRFLVKLIFAESHDKRCRSGKIHRSINFGTQEKRHEPRLLVLLTLYTKIICSEKAMVNSSTLAHVSCRSDLNMAAN